MNLLDRLLLALLPSQSNAQESVSASTQKQDYDDYSETRWRGASRMSRSLRSWATNLGSALTDTPPRERRRLIARSRDAYRNHPIARSAVTRSRTNIVGTGLRLRANVDYRALGITEEEGDALNDTIEREFRLWAENPAEFDAAGMLNFYQHQGLVEVAAMLSGDIFALTPFLRRDGCIYGLKVQTVEADRVCNPGQAANTDKLIDGVEVDLMGAPVAYHVARYHPGESFAMGRQQNWDRVPVWGERTGRRRALHIVNDPTERPGQVRGVPYLAPIIEPLQQISTLTRSELIAGVVASFFTVFVEKEAELTDGSNDPFEQDNSHTTPTASNELALGPGIVADLMPGEKATIANPTRPNANYDPFFNSIVRQIGATLEIPGEMLLLYFSASYSAARASMLQAWQFFRMRRAWLVSMDCEPIYQLWFDEAVARRRIPVTGYGDPARRAAYNRAAWIGPKQGAVDELKEAQAANIRVNELGVSSLTRETPALTGEDYDVIHNERVRERKKRVADGLDHAEPPGRSSQRIQDDD